MSPIARSTATSAVALLIAISVLLLPQVVAAEYPMFHGDPARTGNVSGDAPLTGTLLWNVPLHDTGYVGGGACIAGGRVYVSNWAGWPITDERGLYCLNETTGEIIWRNPIGGTGGVSTPAISGDRMFVGSCTGDLYCINATDGTTVWNRTIESNPLYWGVGSCPLIHESTVFVNTASDGTLFAFDFDGTELWNITAGSTGSAVAYYLSPAAYGGKIFFGGGGPALYCVDVATHTELWNFSTTGTVSTTPAVGDGMVFFATEEMVYALNLNGDEVWNRSMHCRLSSPAVAYGRVYIGDLDKHLNCLDSKNGSIIWSESVDGVVKSSPVVAGGMVYVSEYTGTVYCFDADCGTLIWSYDTNQYNIAQPAVSDGTLFIGSDSGYLYAFRDPPPPPEGDLNHDWAVTAADAVIALRMAVGAVPAIDEADLSGDRRVTSLDALMILQVAAGSINA